MTTYHGPATVITPDGTEHPVITSLRTAREGHLTTWEGHIAAPADTDLTDLLNLDQARMRLSDGREGAVFLSYSGAGSAGGVSLSMRVTGSGEAPF